MDRVGGGFRGRELGHQARLVFGHFPSGISGRRRRGDGVTGDGVVGVGLAGASPPSLPSRAARFAHDVGTK
jgi:hypothetical protein